jgi:tetratricopeptide (TPR) repeat protein
MPPVLVLYEDVFPNEAMLALPALPRMIFVVHGGITIADRSLSDGDSWHGEAAAMLVRCAMDNQAAVPVGDGGTDCATVGADATPAAELLPLARENGFNLWTNIAHFFRGWTMANINGSALGTALMQDTVKALKDQEVDKSCYLGLLGKAYLRTGQLEQAAQAVDQGLNQSRTIGEHYYTAELLRLRGEVELCRGGEPSVAEASFREAIAFAQEQAARSWELNAIESLARLLSSPETGNDARRELQHH